MIFTLLGTSNQQAIALGALGRCTFDWERLRPGLKAATGRDAIPLEWADLSRFAEAAEEAHAAGTHHVHIDEEGDTGHLLVARSRVLGLAWYSGKVSLDLSLEAEPELAGEVLLAEGAHMVDFFWLTPEQRESLFDAFHGGDLTSEVDAPPHDHGWFEETGNNDYWSWVGEAFMGGFLLAYSDYISTLGGFTHEATPEIAAEIRRILGDSSDPPPNPPNPPDPEELGVLFRFLNWLWDLIRSLWR